MGQNNRSRRAAKKQRERRRASAARARANETERHATHLLLARRRFREVARWASTSVSSDELAKEASDVASELAAFDLERTLACTAGLLTVPELQAYGVRIEALIVLADRCCVGERLPSEDDLHRWLVGLGRTRCAIGEDPSEDAFVWNVHDDGANWLLLEGLWEAAGFRAQQFLTALTAMEDTTVLADVDQSTRAALSVSDLVCRRAGLSRYQYGRATLLDDVNSTTIPSTHELSSRVTLSVEDLDELGIRRNDLEPFVRHSSKQLNLEAPYAQSLQERPFVELSDGRLVLALSCSLSIAIRHHILEAAAARRATERLSRALHAAHDRQIRQTPVLGKAPGTVDLHWYRGGGTFVGLGVIGIDGEHALLMRAVVPPIEKYSSGDFRRTMTTSSATERYIAERTRQLVDQLESEPRFQGGLVVDVVASWGCGFAMGSATVGTGRWTHLSLSLADLVRLSWLPGISPSTLWHLSEGLHAVQSMGAHVVMDNGPLNLLGWVRSNSGHIVPHSDVVGRQITPASPFMLSIPTDMLREIRKESDWNNDGHAAYTPEGEKRRLCRFRPRALEVDASQHLYASFESLMNGDLEAVYEERDQALWLNVSSDHGLPTSMQWKLFEMATQWLQRVAPLLFTSGPFAGLRSMRLSLRFEDSSLPEWSKDKITVDALSALCHVSSSNTSASGTALFSAGFLRGFQLADNVAERFVVRSMMRAAYSAAGILDDVTDADEMASAIVDGIEARDLHLFVTDSASEHVGMKLGSTFLGPTPEDDAVLKLGLGWRASSVPADGEIKGKAACTAFLREIVELLIAQLLEELRTFNRRDALEKLCCNAEQARSAEDRWNRTSAGVQGYFGRSEKVLSKMIEQTSEAAGASMLSRALAEMASCTCPLEGGRLLESLSMTRLLTMMSLIVRFAQTSDTIQYGASPQQIVVSGFGELLFDQTFDDQIATPTMQQYRSDVFDVAVSRREQRYELRNEDDPNDATIDVEFVDAWQAEWGLSIDESFQVLGAIDDFAARAGRPLQWMRRSEFIRLCAERELSERHVLEFLSRFATVPRESWREVPEGFRARDIQPWSYDRALSLSSRPIVMLAEEEDPELLIVPSMIRRGFRYVFEGTYSGSFPQTFFRSDTMRNGWWGKASEGHTFNAAAAEVLRSAGLEVREGIEVTGILNAKLDRAYGDVDVLAWERDGSDVWVIECKDLSFTRTQSEMARRMIEYRGTMDERGKPDKLRRHLNRFELLRSRSEAIARFTGVQQPIVRSALLFSSVMPMQFVDSDAFGETWVGTPEAFIADPVRSRSSVASGVSGPPPT